MSASCLAVERGFSCTNSWLSDVGESPRPTVLQINTCSTWIIFSGLLLLERIPEKPLSLGTTYLLALCPRPWTRAGALAHIILEPWMFDGNWKLVLDWQPLQEYLSRYLIQSCACGTPKEVKNDPGSLKFTRITGGKNGKKDVGSYWKVGKEELELLAYRWPGQICGLQGFRVGHMSRHVMTQRWAVGLLWLKNSWTLQGMQDHQATN